MSRGEGSGGGEREQGGRQCELRGDGGMEEWGKKRRCANCGWQWC